MGSTDRRSNAGWSIGDDGHNRIQIQQHEYLWRVILVSKREKKIGMPLQPNWPKTWRWSTQSEKTKQITRVPYTHAIKKKIRPSLKTIDMRGERSALNGYASFHAD